MNPFSISWAVDWEWFLGRKNCIICVCKLSGICSRRNDFFDDSTYSSIEDLFLVFFGFCYFIVWWIQDVNYFTRIAVFVLIFLDPCLCNVFGVT